MLEHGTRKDGLSNNILDAIGGTPMLEVEGVHCKLGYLNPSGSVKARVAKHMVERAEKEGLLIEGISDGFVPGIFERHEKLVDETLTADSGEAVEAMRWLAKNRGLFVGPSSGANLIAAKKVKEAYPELETVVTLFCDEGEKYIQDRFAESVQVTAETYT